MNTRALLVYVALASACGNSASPQPPTAMTPTPSPSIAPAASVDEIGRAQDEARPFDAPSECVRDVPSRFREIATEVTAANYLAATNIDALPWPSYSDSVENGFGLLEHFQGIQRLGRHLIVTGGLTGDAPMSQLIVIEMGSLSVDAAWTQPNANANGFEPSEGDRVVRAIDLDPILWHAGGVQLTEGIAVVALESDDPAAGELRFYDLTNLDAPRELDPRVLRARKLYAAALTRMSDGRFLALSWDDDVIELHRSRGRDLEEGLEDASFTIAPADVIGGFQLGGCGLGCGTYQSMNLLLDCDGGLFVVATRNANKAAPTMPGANLASLYALSWPAEASPSLSFVDRRSFECADRQCNFAAAAGIHVVDEDHLALYSGYHWLQDGGTRLRFNEFASPSSEQ